MNDFVPIERFPYRMCLDIVDHFKDYIKDKVSENIESIVSNSTLQQNIKNLINNNFKNLDVCRSLHAEESSILNVARFGGSASLNGATLYTTTYPCFQCANKIVQVGIKRIIFLEPYQKSNSKKVLSDNNIIIFI